MKEKIVPILPWVLVLALIAGIFYQYKHLQKFNTQRIDSLNSKIK